jgi:hypothetical protein
MLAAVRRALCLLLLAAAAVPASAGAAADPLAVAGGRLVDGRGRAVVLHGVNVVYKPAPYTPDFTRADARRLRGWGMNAIRLGVSWRALEPTRGVIDGGYADWLTTDYGYPLAVRNAASNHAAALVTEFGATDKLDVIRRALDGADAVGVGWMYWQYKTYDDPTTSAAAEGPDAESIVTPGGAVKAAKARALARPSPMRIAGRRARWRYGAADGRFSLRWTAVGGADTVVAVPRLAYPRGFAVRTQGVRVVRRAPLTLRGSGRASIAVTRR